MYKLQGQADFIRLPSFNLARRGLGPLRCILSPVAQAPRGNPAGFHTIRHRARRRVALMDGAPMSANTSPQPAPPLSKSSGSQKRQRMHAVKTALTDVERAEIAQKAQACGLSLSSFSRASMLGTPGPRAQRAPHVNAVELAKATAALNKVGSNLNQMAHVLNAGGASMTADECFAALAETRAALSRILEIVGRKNRV
jgi:hypothetical protein